MKNQNELFEHPQFPMETIPSALSMRELVNTMHEKQFSQPSEKALNFSTKIFEQAVQKHSPALQGLFREFSIEEAVTKENLAAAIQLHGKAFNDKLFHIIRDNRAIDSEEDVVKNQESFNKVMNGASAIQPDVKENVKKIADKKNTEKPTEKKVEKNADGKIFGIDKEVVIVGVIILVLAVGCFIASHKKSS